MRRKLLLTIEEVGCRSGPVLRRHLPSPAASYTHHRRANGKNASDEESLHAAHDGQRLIRRTAAVLARAWLGHPHLRMLSAAPGIVSTTSRVASSTSATMSLTRVRSSCWRARIVTPGASHAAARSSARPAKSGLWPAEQCGQPQCDGAVDVGWPMGHADGDVQVMHPRRRHRSEPFVVPACPEGHCSMGIRPGEHAARAIDVRQASNHGGSFCIGLIWMSVTSAVRGRQRAAMTAAAMSSG